MLDLLARALEGGGFSRENVGVALRAWIAADLLGDQYARMAQAGRSMDADVPLASVFVDLRVSASELGDREALDAAIEQQETFAFAEAMLAERFPAAPAPGGENLRPGCHLLIGGPGQGKSTLGQYIAQVHRAALLRPHREACTAEVRRALDALPDDASKAALTVPARPLFPLRIELRELAAWLVGRDLATTELFDYLAHDVQRITGLPMVAADLRLALSRVPVLLVLDGLDEVSPTGGRDRVMEVLESVLRAREGCADVVLASTRPQGYDGEFRRFQGWHLAPLSKEGALGYARMLIQAWLPERVREQQQKQERVERAAAEDATARLMRSPLQVTILTLIVGHSGRAPRSRWELFHRYYETIYAREQERGTYASELLADYRALLDSVHDLVGLILQAEGESAAQSSSLLSRARLEEVVVHQLRERGHGDTQARALAQEILQAASQRLVLLAELRPGQYGFDVRSLQEFMAARQLTSGDAGVVFERLRAIGHADYWRNVLRFSVGFYFAGNTSAAQRRRMSVQLCERLAADYAEERESGAYPGAELALDLLADGAVGVDLHCVRGLVVQVLPLLNVGWDFRSQFWLTFVLRSWWHALDESDAPVVLAALAPLLDHPEDEEGAPHPSRGISALLDVVLSAFWKLVIKHPAGFGPRAVRETRLRLARRPTELSSPSRWAALELPSPGPAAPPLAEVAPPFFDVVHLTHLKATNLRGFVEFTIAPNPPTEHRGQWIVLLGENGIGKTTILRGVAMTLATPDVATSLLGQSPAVHRRHGTPRGTAAVTVNGHHFGAILNGEPGHESLRADEFTASTPDSARPWTVGYGCRRGSALGGAKREVSFGERDQLDSLFDGDRGLIHAETWLVSQKLAATLAPGSEADARYQAITRVLRAVLNVEAIDVEADTKVWVESAATGRTTLGGLSDGYVTTAGWVIDLLARWVNRCVELKKQLGDRFDTRDRLGGRFHEHMTGVVLLDEIDVYLHPRWQMTVIETVRDLFPRLSFVVTTHNPLTLLGARPGEVWVLRRPDARGLAHALQLDLPKGVRIEHILTGAWFELDSTFDRDTRQRLAEHRDMLRRGVPSSDPRRVELEQVLRERLVSVGDTWIERLGIEAARRVEADRAAPVATENPDEFRRWVEDLIEAKPSGAA